LRTITNYFIFQNKLLKSSWLGFLFFLFLSPLHIVAQVFWTENFSNSCPSNCDAATYTGPNGAWSVTSPGSPNGSDNNPWYVSAAENGSNAGSCSTLNGANACLHIGSNTTINGDVGAAFLNTGLFGTYNILTDLRAESPTIDCSGKTNITLSFNYIENGDGTNDNATLWYFDGSTWMQLIDLAKTTACSSTTSTWTAYAQALPGSADNNPLVRIGFRWVNNDDAVGEDPSIAVDSITLATPSSDSIITGPFTNGPFCGCDTVNIPFAGSGTYNAGNVFTAQLSDATGSFASPVTIGTLASTSNSGIINCTLPCGTATGAGYMIRVISSSPGITGNPNGVNFSVNTAVMPTISMSATFSGSICTDTASFTAITTNGGTSPSYQWQLNGVNVGTDSIGYNPNALLAAGDIIGLTLISNAACAIMDTVHIDTVIVCNSLTTGVIAGSPFCGCDSTDVPFTSAGIFNAGNVYTAQLSDSLGSFAAPVIIGTLTSSANSGTISCVVPCATPSGTNYLIRIISSAPADTAAASVTILTINPVVVPAVSMSATATTALCIDTAITFTAVPTNGGAAPMYQWQRNGVNVGGNSPIYTSSGVFMIGETITVTMVSSAACPTPDSVQAFTIIDCPQLEIPNVFTPNGDGINDLFRVNLSGNALKSFKIDIYDRWGLLMFSSSSINNKWDGRTTAGLKAVNGTYFYIIELNGTQYKGYVMLLQ
jgi:gliding motility-associated-like protein